MEEKRIIFLLVQIDEAHSQAWPIGLPNAPKPHACFQDRLDQANEFIKNHEIMKPFIVKVDGFNNEFASKFRAWPDEYYMIDSNYKVLAKSEYEKDNQNNREGLPDMDCLDLIEEIISRN